MTGVDFFSVSVYVPPKRLGHAGRTVWQLSAHDCPPGTRGVNHRATSAHLNWILTGGAGGWPRPSGPEFWTKWWMKLWARAECGPRDGMNETPLSLCEHKHTPTGDKIHKIPWHNLVLLADKVRGGELTPYSQSMSFSTNQLVASQPLFFPFSHQPLPNWRRERLRAAPTTHVPMPLTPIRQS